MVPGAAIAGPLTVGTRVTLDLPRGTTYEAQVTASEGPTLTLRLIDYPPECVLGDCSVVGLSMPLAWGNYRWLCIVARSRPDWEVDIQLLDGPVFSPSRKDPRVSVTLPSRISFVGPDGLEKVHRAVVTDLSNWGLKLEVGQRMISGDVIEVTMHIPGGPTPSSSVVSILGSVVMTYPRNNDEGRTPSTDVHVSFLDGQEQALQAVSCFVGQELERRRTA